MQKKTVKKNKNTKLASKKEVEVLAAVPVSVPAMPAVPVKSEAELIWDEIKLRPIEMFALPNQTVAQHCAPVPVEPTRLYLTVRSTATLPSLEAAIGKAYEVSLADRFVIVSRAQVPFTFGK